MGCATSREAAAELGSSSSTPDEIQLSRYIRARWRIPGRCFWEHIARQAYTRQHGIVPRLRLAASVIVVACLLVGCSRYWDAVVTNPCKQEAAIGFSGQHFTPASNQLDNLATYTIGPSQSVLLQDALGVPSGRFEGGFAVAVVADRKATFPLLATNSEPVSVSIPPHVCPP